MENEPQRIVEVKTLRFDQDINDHLNQGWVVLQIDNEAPSSMTMRLGRHADVPEYVRTISPEEQRERERQEEFWREIKESRPILNETEDEFEE